MSCCCAVCSLRALTTLSKTIATSRTKNRITFFISLFVDSANEIRGGVGVPVALVPGALRIRADRALHLDALGRIVADVFRRDDLVRRNAVFDPMRERGENIVLRVQGRRLPPAESRGVEPVQSPADAAM